MNRPLRKLLAFSAAAAMLANTPLMGADAKYVAEQVGGKDFDTLVQYPDRNMYIESGTARVFDADQQLVVVGTDGTTKLISLNEGIDGGIKYATTTMGIYDFISITPLDYGFNFSDPSYSFSVSKGTTIVQMSDRTVLVDAEGSTIAEYHAIRPIDGTFFEVFTRDGGVGVIDASGKVIIEPSADIRCVYLTSDGKRFFIDGDGKDYFTDLTGKAVSGEFADLRYMEVNYDTAWRGNGLAKDMSNYKLEYPYFSIIKDEKTALFDADKYEPVSDYFDSLNINGIKFVKVNYYYEADMSYAFCGKNQLYDKDGNVASDCYSYTYLDENGKKVKESTDLAYDKKTYERKGVYYFDENGKEFDSGTFSGAKGGVNSYFLHIRETVNYDDFYDQLLDKEMNVLLEGDDITIQREVAIVVKNGEKVAVYNGKLEKVGEFDEFSRPSGGLGAPDLFIGKSGDKRTIFNDKLEPVIENASASAENIYSKGSYDEDWNWVTKAYYFKDGDTLKVYDPAFKLVKSVPVAEGQSYLVTDDLNVFVYDSAYSAKAVGDYFMLSKDGEEKAKIVDIEGKLIAEISSELRNISGTGFFYSQKDSELCFYNAKGELMKKFDSSNQFSPGTPGDYTYVINGKDAETGKTASYVYDLVNDTVKYSQVGKYDSIELAGLDCVQTIVYPEGTDEDAQLELWSSDSGFKTGIDKFDGTQLIAPMSGVSVNVAQYCFGGYSNAGWRDNAIDVIYNDGADYYDGQEFCDPATGNNDTGYIVLNGVYVPVKDFAPDFASTNGFDAAIKTQYGNYVVIKDGKWGMASAEGKVLGELKYQRIFEFADGIAYAVEKETITYMDKEYDHYDSEAKKTIYKDVEKTKVVNKYGLITKDGVEVETPAYYNNGYNSPVNDAVVMYRSGNSFYTSHIDREEVQDGDSSYTKVDVNSYHIYKGKDYFNEFTAKYGYDTAVQYGDLWVVSKNGLKGVVTNDNEEVLPIEFAEVLNVPADEPWLMNRLSKDVSDTLSDQHYSSAISELGDGSKLINVKTSEGRIRAYQIRDIEETTTSTTVTTTTTTETTTTTTTLQSTTTTTTTATTTTEPTTTTTTATTSTTAPATTTTAGTPSTDDERIVGQWYVYMVSWKTEKGFTDLLHNDDHYIVIFKNDGTFTVHTKNGTGYSVDSGTWSISGDDITLVRPDGVSDSAVLSDSWTFKGQKWIVVQDNKEITLVRGGRFTAPVTTTTTATTTSVTTTTTSSESTTAPDSTTTTQTTAASTTGEQGTTTTETTPAQPENELGDLTGDGKVDAKDASAVLVAYSKASTGGDDGLTELQRAISDVNGDGKTDAKDASAILAFYAMASTAEGVIPTLKEYLASRS